MASRHAKSLLVAAAAAVLVGCGGSNAAGAGGSNAAGAGGSGAGGAGATPNRDAAPDGALDALTALDAGRCGTTYPAECLNLMGWKLTLPIGTSGNPDEITWPALRTFTITPYFQLNPAGPGVVFQANAGGVSTSNSGYPRSELREMTSDGSNEIAWSASSGKHTMLVTEAFTHLPVVKPEAVAAQIHNQSDDVIMIRLNTSDLFVEHNGTNLGDLAPTYELGTFFNLKIEASGGHILVYYNDLTNPKVDIASSSCGSSGSPQCYFKAGVYTQSNTSKGDQPTAYGEVVITALSVTHQ